MRYRPQRGSFADSIAEMVEVKSLDELKAQLAKGHFPEEFVRFEDYSFDKREPWNAPTFLVMAKFPNEKDAEKYAHVSGMTDSDRFDDDHKKV